MTLCHLPTASDLGLLLVGHGTRDRQGLDEFRQVAEMVSAAATDVHVERCFLELAEPSIEQAVARLIERGVRRMTVQPLLLFSAGHARRDIPQAVRSALEKVTAARASQKLPSLPAVWQAAVLGCHPQVLELSGRRYGEARTCLDCARQVPAAETLLLIVGRGSRDAEANAEFARFAQLRYEQELPGGLETCFVAMARPTLDEGLERGASLPFQRVVVQPHLLFSGELWHSIRAAVDAARQRRPDRQWIVTQPLGADELLVQALMSRAGLLGDAEHRCGPNFAETFHLAAQPIWADGLGPRADLALPRDNV